MTERQFSLFTVILTATLAFLGGVLGHMLLYAVIFRDDLVVLKTQQTLMLEAIRSQQTRLSRLEEAVSEIRGQQAKER